MYRSDTSLSSVGSFARVPEVNGVNGDVTANSLPSVDRQLLS